MANLVLDAVHHQEPEVSIHLQGVAVVDLHCTQDGSTRESITMLVLVAFW